MGHSPHTQDGATVSSYRHRGQRGPRARACAECKRHKIRCEVRRGEMACVRCLRTGIECSPHDPVQRLLDDNEAWKAQATAQIHQLQAAVAALLQRGHLPDLPSFSELQPNGTSPTDSAIGNVSTTESVIAPYDVRESSPDRRADDPGLIQAPMSNLYELTKATQPVHRHARASSSEHDLVSSGVLSTSCAEQLLARFLRHQNPLLWGGIIFPYRTLDALRCTSVLLSTAVFTIAALHSPGGAGADVLQRCYDAYVALVSRTSLSRSHSLDDIRALILGAFYLPNLSWRLSGMAVRMAAEMDIHQAFHKVMNGDVRHAERVRLWYALYVCDRHFSMAYQRPSAMADDEAIRGVERFLEATTSSGASVPGDVRICAQVALFKILAEAHADYGSDVAAALDAPGLDRLRAYSTAIEQWRMLWQPRSLDVAGIGSYPSQGVVLYYHFARFQLNSLALRGVRWPSDEPLCLGRREAATAAVSAAMSTLLHISGEPDMRQALNGVPLFTHTMIALCATFLLKVAAIWARGNGDHLSQSLGLGFHLAEIVGLARRTADLLSRVAEEVSEKHLMRLIVAGIREMLQRLTLTLGDDEMPAQPRDAGTDAQARDAQHDGAAVDFAAVQMGEGVDGMVYNMDLHSLAGLLEYGSDPFLDPFVPNELESWAPS